MMNWALFLHAQWIATPSKIEPGCMFHYYDDYYYDDYDDYDDDDDDDDDDYDYDDYCRIIITL